jgi:hypothetical protein
LLILSIGPCYGQSTDSSICVKHDFYFIDSAFGEQAIYQNSPTGMIVMPDGSIIVSSKLSTYLERSEDYSSKTHTSSGTLFMLDSSFSKQWELVFKEERIVDLKILNDSSFLVFVERTDMRKIWVACINKSGDILWKKYYSEGYESTIADVAVDSLNNLFILLESVESILFNNSKFEALGITRLNFSGYLYLIKLNNNGTKVWVKSIKKRKNTFYGVQLFIANNTIFTLSNHFDQKRKTIKHNYYFNKQLIIFNQKGRIEERKGFQFKTIIGFNSGLVSCNEVVNETLNIYLDDTLMNTILIPEEIKHLWIKGAQWIDNELVIFGTTDHNLGNLLLGLNQDFELIWYWTDNGDLNTSSDGFAPYKSESILFLSERWDNNTTNKTAFISISEIKEECKLRP